MNPVMRYCLYFAVGYGMLVVTVYLMQRRMIYFPDRAAPPVEVIRHAELKQWPQEGIAYKGFVAAHSMEDVRGTVVVFHGNAGAAWHRDYYIHALRPLGYDVILAEYPGYGNRPGETSEAELVADAMETLRHIAPVESGPIYLLGESMGCGVVAAVAADPPVPVAGLVLITPWDTLPNLAQTLYWYLPARWLTKDRFDNVSHLENFNRPVAMAIAENDRVVPNKHSLRLFSSLTGPKRIWRFEDAGHNDWPTHPQAQWWQEVMRFVSQDRTEIPESTKP